MKDKNINAVELLDNLIGMIEDSQGNDYDEAFNKAISDIQKLEKIEDKLNEIRNMPLTEIPFLKVIVEIDNIVKES